MLGSSKSQLNTPLLVFTTLFSTLSARHLFLARTYVRTPVLCAAAEGAHTLFPTVYTDELLHGRCVLVELPNLLEVPITEELRQELDQGMPSFELHPTEAQHMSEFGPMRKLFFAGGRLALRRAIRAAEALGDAGPVLPGELGAPTLPKGLIGSISHTHGLAAAIVGTLPPDAEQAAVGIDVESVSRQTSSRLARRILAPVEREQMERDELELPDHAGLTLRFSLKEALYKALHPILRRSINWHSVCVRPLRDGSCELDLDVLIEQTGVQLTAEARWVMHGDFFVTTAKATSLASGSSAGEGGSRSGEGRAEALGLDRGAVVMTSSVQQPNPKR